MCLFRKEPVVHNDSACWRQERGRITSLKSQKISRRCFTKEGHGGWLFLNCYSIVYYKIRYEHKATAFYLRQDGQVHKVTYYQLARDCMNKWCGLADWDYFSSCLTQWHSHSSVTKLTVTHLGSKWGAFFFFFGFFFTRREKSSKKTLNTMLIKHFKAFIELFFHRPV